MRVLEKEFGMSLDRMALAVREFAFRRLSLRESIVFLFLYGGTVFCCVSVFVLRYFRGAKGDYPLITAALISSRA